MTSAETVAATDIVAAPPPATEPPARRLRKLTISRIAAQDSLAGLEAENPANLDWRFLCNLRDAGRDAAESWIAEGAAAESRRG